MHQQTWLFFTEKNFCFFLFRAQRWRWSMATPPPPSTQPAPTSSRRPSPAPTASRSSASSRRRPTPSTRTAPRSGPKLKTPPLIDPPASLISNHGLSLTLTLSHLGVWFRVGVVFSGRQSPGGHNVIWGLHDALKAYNPHSVLYGFVGNCTPDL